MLQFGECSDSPILPDDDNDAVLDTLDNCLGESNPDQLDTNNDGYGNPCDSDLTNDGLVGLPDFLVLTGKFGLSVGDPGYDPEVDFTGEGKIGVPDFLVLSEQWGGRARPVGPLLRRGLRELCGDVCAVSGAGSTFLLVSGSTKSVPIRHRTSASVGTCRAIPPGR